MKMIELTHGKFAIVDDCDFDRVNQFKWCLHIGRHTDYAIRGHRIDGKIKQILMHRFIMDAPNGILIDHRDRNGLNNVRENLRFATRSQNAMNQIPHGSSKYLGVCWDKNLNKWRAKIKYNHQKFLGLFDNEIDAAMAYDLAAIKYFGQFANLNFKQCKHV